MSVIVDVRCDECLRLASERYGEVWPSPNTAKLALIRRGWYFPKPPGRGRIRCDECLADDNLIAEKVE